eukprot:jgi/Bigna1/66153/fgenesh1_pg.1_\
MDTMAPSPVPPIGTKTKRTTGVDSEYLQAMSDSENSPKLQQVVSPGKEELKKMLQMLQARCAIMENSSPRNTSEKGGFGIAKATLSSTAKKTPMQLKKKQLQANRSPFAEISNRVTKHDETLNLSSHEFKAPKIGAEDLITSIDQSEVENAMKELGISFTGAESFDMEELDEKKLQDMGLDDVALGLDSFVQELNDKEAAKTTKLARWRRSKRILTQPHPVSTPYKSEASEDPQARTKTLTFSTKTSIGLKFLSRDIKLVRNGSHAERMGVKVGWKILSVNGDSSLQKTEDILKAIKKEPVATIKFGTAAAAAAAADTTASKAATTTTKAFKKPLLPISSSSSSSSASTSNGRRVVKARATSSAQRKIDLLRRPMRSAVMANSTNNSCTNQRSKMTAAPAANVSSPCDAAAGRTDTGTGASLNSNIAAKKKKTRKKTMKVIVIGNAKCAINSNVSFAIVVFLLAFPNPTGKTSVINRFVHGRWSHEYRSTIGCDYHSREVRRGDSKIRLQLWDIAGQDRFIKLTRAYYPNATGIVVVCDVSRPATLRAVEQWKKELDESLLGEARRNNWKVPVILIANKVDLLKTGTTSFLRGAEIQKMSQSMGFDSWYIGSAKEDTNISEAIDYLIDKMLEEQVNRGQNGLHPSSSSSSQRSTAQTIKLTAESLLMSADQSQCWIRRPSGYRSLTRKSNEYVDFKLYVVLPLFVQGQETSMHIMCWETVSVSFLY